MNAAGVAKAAEGRANPPMYRNWPKLVLPMLESTIAAAKASGARILFPGSIYNFPPDGPLVLREDTPQRATTRKGVIRIVMERRLEEAQAQGRAQFDFARRRFLRSIYDWQQLVPAACQRTSGIPGPICRMLAKPWRCSRSGMQALPASRCFTSRAIGSSAGSRWQKPYAPSLPIRTCRSEPCLGDLSGSRRLLCR
jgi:hypothetical protein